jgi:uncharacterized protein with FMN-binding domain
MEENQSTQTNGGNKNLQKYIMIGVAVVVIIVIALAGGYFFLNSSSDTEGDSATGPNNTPEEGVMEENVEAEEGAMMEVNQTSYADGIYTATGTYDYHSGLESIEITLTLESGVITEASAVNQAEDPTSVRIQDDFIANFESEVVGKNIDEVELGKVSGSSLTPLGFNEAVENIKQQASS